jgi:hypothetical protein
MGRFKDHQDSQQKHAQPKQERILRSPAII